MMNYFRFYLGAAKDLVVHSTRTQRDVALAGLILLVIIAVFL